MSLLEQLPPVRRIVTGHDANGRAVFRIDETVQPEPVPAGTSARLPIWNAPMVPADMNDTTDGRYLDVPLGQGSNIRVVDFMPGNTTPMHRTCSVDYAILLAGTMELELDDGAIVTLKPGDMVVQCGTIHRWRNPSETEPCRIIFMLTNAKPYVHNGEELGELWL